MKRLLIGLIGLEFLVAPLIAQAAVDIRVTVGQRKIVVFNEGVNAAEQESLLHAEGTVTIRSLDTVAASVAIIAPAGEAELLASGKVKRIDEDIEMYALQTDEEREQRRLQRKEDKRHRQEERQRRKEERERRRQERNQPPPSPIQILPWGVTSIGADQAWSRSTGRMVKVAIVDSGVDLNHPDLVRNLKTGVNFVHPGQPPDDDNGHGTHVAGVVGAVNNGIGTVGVAVDAELYPVKVLDRRGRGYLSDIIAGIDWSVANGMDVVNLSLGAGIDILSLHEAIQRATNAGVVVVAAAGNSGDEVLYPAAYAETIAVGMVDQSNQVHRKSSRGPELDLVAPGVDVLSTYPGGRYELGTGTSMAAPHVAGVAALLRAEPARCDQDGDRRCGGAEILQRLQATATDLLVSGRDDESGAGIVNALRALTP